MAHFKRGKCRRNAPHAIRGSEASRRKRLGLKPYRVDHDRYHIGCREWRIIWPDWYNFTSSYPAWWDREFHTRPKRVATKRLERAIVRGLIDPDDTAWPLGSRKPTNYYW